jgi:hypothetical protein
MNSQAKNDSNHFSANDVGYKEIIVEGNKHAPNENTRQHIKKNNKVVCNDVSTASYLRGYN